MRLNSGYRLEIERAAIEGAFGKEDKKLLQREHALAKRCYEAVIPPKVRRLIEEMPPDWFYQQTTLRFNIAGACIELTGERAVAIPERVRADRYREYVGIISEGSLSKDVLTLIADKEESYVRKNKTITTLKALIGQYATTDELAKLWPEGKPYWKHLDRKIPVSNLPAVRIEELNAMLGLAQPA